MKILGIETSCDETAVCLIKASGTGPEDFTYKVLGNALYSQVAIHAPYGGVFPNLAKREHAKNLVPLLTQALQQSGLLLEGLTFQYSGRSDLPTLLVREPELLEQLTEFLAQYGKPDIDAIAVTAGPGLEPALWVGVNFARALSLVWDIPIVAVNHMEGHVMMSMAQCEVDSEQLTVDRREIASNPSVNCKLSTVDFPLLSLLISGGHTELVLSTEWMKYQRIGETRDDAVGEAFDKVARMLGLPYPGGPEISRLAASAHAEGITEVFALPRPMIGEDNYDFSFSGLKTAVKRLAEAHPDMSDDEKKDLAREFEDAAADVLVAKTLRAAEEYGAQTVLVGGGVSANTYIRQRLAEATAGAGHIQLLVPPPELATDNALMIALPGYFRALKKEFADLTTLRANGNLRLS
ncbi:tRNA (adenosine(37)-N6)-threonylcarbamoyltransferase complex transferase subunit TsaD [Candidatus Kaiserbacteria bacterium]|nr:tRNA (adenosine(37)-N6)-threonylcarbamoyltransferase complex transferase subunit TsaD [Candidatus Kaiserbacteria bacterium]